MESRWAAWFEFIGLSAVVLSLVFVGMQMQQQRELTRASLGARGMEYHSRITQTLSEPGMARSWAKMLESPKDLSSAEMVQVNSVLSMVADAFMRDCYLKALQVFEECDYLLNAKADEYFGSAYAKAWWNNNRPPEGYGFLGEIDSAINNLSEHGSHKILEEIRQAYSKIAVVSD